MNQSGERIRLKKHDISLENQIYCANVVKTCVDTVACKKIKYTVIFQSTTIPSVFYCFMKNFEISYELTAHIYVLKELSIL